MSDVKPDDFERVGEDGLFASLKQYNEALDRHENLGHTPEFSIFTAGYRVRIECARCSPNFVFEYNGPNMSIVQKLLRDGAMMPVFDEIGLIKTTRWIDSIRPFSVGDGIDLSGLRRCPTCLRRFLILQVICAAPGVVVATWNCNRGCGRPSRKIFNLD